MTKCRLHPKLQCGYNECTPKCEVLRQTGQRTLFEAPLQVIEKKKRKGHTVTYYKVPKR